ncbi:MAG: hypothetical protein M1817_003000 [Caeruleum heppii]|nr:MAG: hypothetical protein M1817_003000 [Caeruleum heppii]
MAPPKSPTKGANRDISDLDTDDLFASPSQSHHTAETSLDLKIADKGNAAAKTRNAGSRMDAEAARDAALRKELDGVRSINEVIEGVIGSLEKAKDNMETVSRTVTSASTLLNTWIRILSQTEHNQRLILNPSWQGAGQDVADLENESILKQQAAERREIEEQQRREAATRKAAEAERQRAEGTVGRGTRGTRPRGRGVPRGRAVASSGYGAPQSGYVGRGEGAIPREASIEEGAEEEEEEFDNTRKHSKHFEAHIPNDRRLSQMWS